MEKIHPSEPHWYLALLGTHPDHQGQGLGTAVVAPGIAAADAEGVGCYLESSKEANVPYYERLGFEVIGTYDVDRGSGPRLWLMWRDPTPPSSAN
jgi:ribosomal protein S18 acetylase RimI-like enzyme